MENEIRESAQVKPHSGECRANIVRYRTYFARIHP